jgi:hypothetical protein
MGMPKSVPMNLTGRKVAVITARVFIDDLSRSTQPRFGR